MSSILVVVLVLLAGLLAGLVAFGYSGHSGID